MAEPLIVVKNLNKSFPGVHALKDVQFDLYPGEVHTLVGENGAGKSTLMKVLSGVYQKDSGEVLLDGKPVSMPNPKAAQRLGISIIHQELNLMNHLTAAQNIFIGREPKKGPFLDEKALNKKASDLFAMLKMDIDPRVKIRELTIAKQQMVEIVKALSYDARVLIMDEPTAALNDAEIEELFAIIRDLRSKSVAIIYISHRMDELFRISDRITVMRDGQYVDTLKIGDTNLDRVISLMVGRTIDASVPQIDLSANKPVMLKVKGLSQGNVLKNINFEAKKGEILGFAGLMGAGRTEAARAIFGADPINAGEIWVNGRKVIIRRPVDAVRHGIGYLSEDRKRFGVAISMDVEMNSAMASMPRFTGFAGFVKNKEIRKAAMENVKKLSIKTPSLQQKLKFLSGGNQQKVVVAKWLIRNCDILIFDEPTRGIDIGAKQEIYTLLNELALAGKTIIMISSELPEILRLSHRIVVMCEGRITGELAASEATQEKIMKLATQRETMVKAQANQ
ncbi:MAG TPA: sugar ABC transporter ATP-binding protein [Rectinemataceae bacterium]|nr:sugar ABC transporter ATP-binding protein [Rectinemataceae bacterium]